MATGFDHGGISLDIFNSPMQTTPARCKDHGDITYTSRVIAYFVSNFVAMATGASRGRIFL